MHNKNPCVSIGMPVFNGENYIHEAISSLLAQTFTSFELIISDNASMDNTEIICKKFAEQDKRIRYIRQPENFGATANFRYVLDQSSGEYFMWAAHDDIWDKEWLAVLLENITADDIGIRGYVKFSQDQKIVKNIYPTSFNKGEFVRYFLEYDMCGKVFHIYGLFKMEKLKGIDFEPLNCSYASDVIYVYTLLKKGSLRTVGGTYQVYRKNPESVSNKIVRERKMSERMVRLIYKVYPMSYYKCHIKYSDKRTKKIILLLAPYKHLTAQLKFWWQVFRRIILRLSY
jgi:glycosyltransferase involved in cell wall biosynthesis